MCCESFDVVRFDIGPLLQGQTRTVKLKSAYYSLIIGPRNLQCETNQHFRPLNTLLKVNVYYFDFCG